MALPNDVPALVAHSGTEEDDRTVVDLRVEPVESCDVLVLNQVDRGDLARLKAIL